MEAQLKAMNNFSTQGASVSGEQALIAMDRLTRNVDASTSNMVTGVAQSQKKLNTLKSQYYEYALKKQIELEFGSVAVELFNKYFPDYKEKMYKTKSGKDIDVSGDHYKNKISAVIEKLEDKSASKTIVGSNIIYWMLSELKKRSLLQHMI